MSSTVKTEVISWIKTILLAMVLVLILLFLKILGVF